MTIKKMIAVGAIIAAMSAGEAQANCPQVSGEVCNAHVASILPAEPDSCAYFRLAEGGGWYAVPLFGFILSDNQLYPDSTHLVALLDNARVDGQPIGFFTRANLDPNGDLVCSQPSTIMTDLRLGSEAVP
jgi:hypothetical protein